MKRTCSQHASIVNSCIGIVGAHGQLFTSYRVDCDTFGFQVFGALELRARIVEEETGSRARIASYVVLQDVAVLATAPDQSGRVDAGFETLDTAVMSVQLMNTSVLVHIIHVDVSISGRARHE